LFKGGMSDPSVKDNFSSTASGVRMDLHVAVPTQSRISVVYFYWVRIIPSYMISLQCPKNSSAAPVLGCKV
jgi:hypothetical protein